MKKRDRAFRPSVGQTHQLEERALLNGSPWFFYNHAFAYRNFAAQAAKTAWPTVVAVHNQYYAPLYNNALAQVRAENARVLAGQETLAQAKANLSIYLNNAIAQVNSGSQALVAAHHPYRGAAINAAIGNINAQLTNTLLGPNGIITLATNLGHGVQGQVAHAIRGAYSQVRVAIETAGVPVYSPWAPIVP